MQIIFKRRGKTPAVFSPSPINVLREFERIHSGFLGTIETLAQHAVPIKQSDIDVENLVAVLLADKQQSLEALEIDLAERGKTLLSQLANTLPDILENQSSLKYSIFYDWFIEKFGSTQHKEIRKCQII